jgi:hypothetical protein
MMLTRGCHTRLLAVNHAAEILPGFIASAAGLVVMGWAPELLERVTHHGRVRAPTITIITIITIDSLTHSLAPQKKQGGRDVWDRRMEQRDEATFRLIRAARQIDAQLAKEQTKK